MSTPESTPERTESPAEADGSAPPVAPGLDAADGVLRDRPFGAGPFGGETPFFVGGGDDGFVDDTDGIPVGIPDLLELPELDTEEPSLLPEEPPMEITPMVDALRAERPAASGGQDAFWLGFAIACLFWGLGISAWRLLA